MAKYSNGLEDRLNLPESSVTVLEKRYLKKDPSGKIIETGEDMLRRVAKDIASADAFYMPEFKKKVNVGMPAEDLYKITSGDDIIRERENEFFNIMINGYFLPNSPTLMNAGRGLQQLSGCFVLPIEDSMESIGETQKNMMLVHKSGGGTGFNFSRLRPNGGYINSTGGQSSGPLEFLRAYDSVTDVVKQGGTRRGANMGILRANHPDALDWIRVKNKEGLISNFNLSIAFNDEEIESVKNNKYILLGDSNGKWDYSAENILKRAKEIDFKFYKFKTSLDLSKDKRKVIDTYTGYEIGDINDGKVYLNAKKLFDILIDSAWKNGEPGIIFIDKMNYGNPTPQVGMIESTNPCGEQPLLPYESCNLGSIDLSKMVNNDSELNKSLLEKTVRSATRFLDNVIDRNKYPIQEIDAMTKANRKIGLGVMGFAHMLIKKGISYNSSEAVQEAEYLMNFINEISKNESENIAKERGPFQNFKQSIYQNGVPIRNSTRTTIAPTGTIGVIASTSQGIEPIYQLITLRNVKDTLGANLVEVDRCFKDYLNKKGLYDEKILSKMAEDGIGIDDLMLPKVIKSEMKRLFVISQDIPPEQHIKIQAAFQKYTDNAVSKTINMPNSATKEDVANAYLLAHQSGCKGLTIYRDGSRKFELLTLAGKRENSKNLIPPPMKIPSMMPSVKIRQPTSEGNIHLEVVVDPKENYLPVEVFAQLGNAGSVENATMEALGRMTSLHLRRKLPLDEIIAQCKEIGSGKGIVTRAGGVHSLPMGFARGLMKFQIMKEKYGVEKFLLGDIEDYTNIDENISDILRKGNGIMWENYRLPEENLNSKSIDLGKCPDCKNRTLIHVEGCNKCQSCGYSDCG